jgi:transposase
VYKDIAQWVRVRKQILEAGNSKRAVCKKEYLCSETVQKMLLHERPPGYQEKKPRQARSFGEQITTLNALLSENDVRSTRTRRSGEEIFRILCKQGYKGSAAAVRYQMRRHEDADEVHLWKLLQSIVRTVSEADATAFLSSLFSRGTLGNNTAAAQRRRHMIHQQQAALRPAVAVRPHWDTWLSSLEQKGTVDAKSLSAHDIERLLTELLPTRAKERKKALTVLAHDHGFATKHVASFLAIGISTARHYLGEFGAGHPDRLFGTKPKPRKADNEELKKTVFSLLHEPPSLAGLNRTTWRMTDLEQVLKARGMFASYKVLQKIIKTGGYRWKAARVVLTSKDPTYKDKLTHIQGVLASLQEDERFFSIDEFGPFTVKMKGGRLLAAPGVQPTVPQWQSSKGRLILTAALELSRNQVSHFYSASKNSGEMIKLAELLVQEYQDVRKLYLSWDAASWHKSKKLSDFIANHNFLAESQHLPAIELVALPANAQFLNVIESVFSGMARAIIHNSDYASLDAAKNAIDLYLAERNHHFLRSPKRAGKKIWGLEQTSSQFASENNCKNPKYR